MKWQTAWKELPAAAAELERPDDFEISPDQAATLKQLGAWRNYLMHKDPDVRDWLHAAIVAQEHIAPDAGEEAIVNLLNADLARWAVTTFEQFVPVGRGAHRHFGSVHRRRPARRATPASPPSRSFEMVCCSQSSGLR
ncbi:hypothetical protein FH608_048660 [Nonomuraea phyllanthi]|uniref:Uncharacterized protein n=1 Tax=Nonomuraea phyllanthi TaxID=2219224 RepID=A0A5C4V1I4_9ACTN|nr:hypothetical protein [Nonomuraea phyllanthi]KAB8183916.1 hypothetical protein FH608_048660 [Nonomuraea phyllanthi]